MFFLIDTMLVLVIVYLATGIAVNIRSFIKK